MTASLFTCQKAFCVALSLTASSPVRSTKDAELYPLRFRIQDNCPKILNFFSRASFQSLKQGPKLRSRSSIATADISQESVLRKNTDRGTKYRHRPGPSQAKPLHSPPESTVKRYASVPADFGAVLPLQLTARYRAGPHAHRRSLSLLLAINPLICWRGSQPGRKTGLRPLRCGG